MEDVLMEDCNTPPHKKKERMMEMNDMVDLLEFGLSRMEKDWCNAVLLGRLLLPGACNNRIKQK
jgi:hypothetical protein